MAVLLWTWMSLAWAEPPHDASADGISEVEAETRLAEALPSEPLEIHAWAEAGYMAAFEGPEPSERGAYLSLARLQVRLHEDGFAAFIQAGADSGDLQLLDARATWRPTDAVAVRAGRFKTAVSAEYGIPANHLIFIHRSLHMALVPKRAMGAELELHARPGDLDLSVQAGLFNPVGFAPVPGGGELATGRLLVDTPVGLGFHVAGATWIHDDGAAEVLGDEAPAYDQHLDGAVLYEEHGWTAVAEGAWARDGVDAEPDLGGVVSLARRFATGAEGFEIEPAVAVEALEQAREVQSLGQLAVNFHKSDWNLIQTVEWEVGPTPEGIGQAVYLQLQAGL